MSWGVNFAEIYRQAATYVDRILRSVKPEDLPVQAPTKFDLVINLKTAKALSILLWSASRSACNIPPGAGCGAPICGVACCAGTCAGED
jgi:ABC-type uncharacterized transport system substrate-binding protein